MKLHENHFNWIKIRENKNIYQFLNGKPYYTRYFCNKPIIDPNPWMMGQRVYRNFVLEDLLSKELMSIYIANDHSFSSIKYFKSDLENYHYLEENIK